MGTLTKPFLTSTALSIVLHGAVLVAVLLVLKPSNPTTQVLDIHLLGAVLVSAENPNGSTEEDIQPILNATQAAAVSELTPIEGNTAHRILQNISSVKKTSVKKKRKITKFEGDELKPEPTVEKQSEESLNSHLQKKSLLSDEMQVQKLEQALIASSHVSAANLTSDKHDSLQALLHKHISGHQRYPYLAKRQRREGTATISFVLKPSGEINQMNLVKSSATAILDRAAIDAIKRIDPFLAAQDYLEKPKMFQLDVIFKLM